VDLTFVALINNFTGIYVFNNCNIGSEFRSPDPMGSQVDF
jgi:hypothetical protein